jgi:hypothetical protein
MPSDAKRAAAALNKQFGKFGSQAIYVNADISYKFSVSHSIFIRLRDEIYECKGQDQLIDGMQRENFASF